MISTSFLCHKAFLLRKWSLIETTHAGSGHPTTCLSAADIVAVLFFYAMVFDPSDPQNPNNDRFILSKGHASALLYAAWHEAGVISEQDLMGYRQIDSVLEGHPTFRFKYAEAATGSLGMGLSIGVGQALAALQDKRSYYTYVLLGDSEMSEGSIWEAVQVAAYYKLANLVGIIDCNRLGQTTQTMFGTDADRYARILKEFGWNVKVVDGHDIAALQGAFDWSRAATDAPSMIIARTIKGYGLPSIQDKIGFHGKAFKKEQLPNLLQELAAQFPIASDHSDVDWQPSLPKQSGSMSSCSSLTIAIEAPSYNKGAMVATREAFGQALVALGDACDAVVSLDAEVSNSTYACYFQEKYPERFVECFIAEQNMVSMAVGMNKRGKIPFASTFGAFFSRAYDQIRMSALGGAAIRLVGSHVGVSIGYDGPSQMALEDIGMICAVPGSVVLYPSDAVSAYLLLADMARYNSGISYMRTTREATPVLYDGNEQFKIGGCKILRQSNADSVCIIAAGITVREALRAYDMLVNHATPVYVSVIDLYSIKPFDYATVIAVARASGSRIITIEDHYYEGGIGSIIASAVCNDGLEVHTMAVRELPRSGAPDELLAYHKIDAHSLVKKVREILC